jgi:hypothetical protein
MESDLKEYIIAAHAARKSIPLPSSSDDASGRTCVISAEEEIAAAIAIRNALLAIMSIDHHDPVELRKTAQTCLETGAGSSSNDFKTLMYHTIISEIGRGNPLNGAHTIIQLYNECAGEYGRMIKLIGENSKKQDAWRKMHSPLSPRINDVALFELEKLDYEGLYEAANRTIDSARRNAYFRAGENGQGNSVS